MTNRIAEKLLLVVPKLDILNNNPDGRLYSRTVLMQNKFVAELNRILNCDWSLRSIRQYALNDEAIM